MEVWDLFTYINNDCLPSHVECVQTLLNTMRPLEGFISNCLN